MADPKTALVNLGELSKPATTLIDRVSKAIGGVFRPYQIKRVAKAEAEAEVIRAEGQIRVTDLQRRAFYRFLDEEATKQANIEEITRKAIPDLASDAKPESIENDWLVHFFDKSRLVSDEEMQQLWSRVLAGEANKQGSFSKRAVDTLSSLDKRDAAAFTSLCTFCWVVGNLTPLIFDTRSDPSIYTRHGITFGSIMHLESIGLVQFESLSGFVTQNLPKHLTVYYYGTPLELTLPSESQNELAIGKVILTRTGSELAPITGSKPDAEFIDYVRDVWKVYLPPQQST